MTNLSWTNNIDKPPRKSVLETVKSRERLFIEKNDSLNNIKLELRRTKIIASISDKTNHYERVNEMILAGANCLKCFILNL